MSEGRKTKIILLDDRQLEILVQASGVFVLTFWMIYFFIIFQAACRKRRPNLILGCFWSILCCYIFVLNDLYFIDLVVVDLVLC